jgi:hypothetical protein
MIYGNFGESRGSGAGGGWLTRCGARRRTAALADALRRRQSRRHEVHIFTYKIHFCLEEVMNHRSTNTTAVSFANAAGRPIDMQDMRMMSKEADSAIDKQDAI